MTKKINMTKITNRNAKASGPKYSNRPYIIINCAMSIDGKIALANRKPLKLSSLEDFRRVHELRNYCDGILVGINTIIEDDPKLNVKAEYVIRPKNPTRIVLDSMGRTPQNANVLDGSVETFIIVSDDFKGSEKKFENVELIQCQMENKTDLNLDKLLKILKERGIDNLLVEGGETVIFNFLKNQLVDELYVYISSQIIGGVDSPTMAGGDGFLHSEQTIKLELYTFKRLGSGILLKYLLK